MTYSLVTADQSVRLQLRSYLISLTFTQLVRFLKLKQAGDFAEAVLNVGLRPSFITYKENMCRRTGGYAFLKIIATYQ